MFLPFASIIKHNLENSREKGKPIVFTHSFTYRVLYSFLILSGSFFLFCFSFLVGGTKEGILHGLLTRGMHLMLGRWSECRGWARDAGLLQLPWAWLSPLSNPGLAFRARHSFNSFFHPQASGIWPFLLLSPSCPQDKPHDLFPPRASCHSAGLPWEGAMLAPSRESVVLWGGALNMPGLSAHP